MQTIICNDAHKIRPILEIMSLIKWEILSGFGSKEHGFGYEKFKPKPISRPINFLQKNAAKVIG